MAISHPQPPSGPAGHPNRGPRVPPPRTGTPVSDLSASATLSEELSPEERLLEVLSNQFKASEAQKGLETVAVTAVTSSDVLKALFNTVASKLAEIDKTARSDFQSKHEPFAPKWRVLHLQFLRLLTDSQSLARSMANGAHRFNEFILQPALEMMYFHTVPRSALQDVIDEIPPFIKSWKRYQREAEALKDKFQLLQSEIATLSDSLKKFGKPMNELCDQLKHVIGSSERRIQAIPGELKDLADLLAFRNKFDRTCLNLGTVLTGALACAKRIPTGWVTASGVATTLITVMTRYLVETATLELAAKKRELEKVRIYNDTAIQRLDGLTPLQTMVTELLQRELNSIAEDIGSFEAFWSEIGSNCQTIRDALECAHDSSDAHEIRLPRSFAEQCKKAAFVSALLVQPLDVYAQGVRGA